MPSQSPLRPNLQKGALAVYPTHTPGAQPSTILVFQFNPESMRRTLAHRAPPPSAEENGKAGGGKQDALRVGGLPLETINLTVEMHASDQLDDPDGINNSVVAENGLHPALAALELLMYPPMLATMKIKEQAAQGAVQSDSAALPLVLLVWGKSRVVPVKLTSFSISEDAFDRRLNPIAAKVELGMQVLSNMELAETSIGCDVFLAYQKSKENLAQRISTGSVLPPGIRDLLPP
jgi:hypothetical protein